MKLGLIISSFFYFVMIIMLMQNEDGSCNGCLESERIGLLDIKHYFLSHKVSDSEFASWVDDRVSNCCTWDGVTCSNTSSGHITQLSLDWLLTYSSDHMIMMNVSLFRPFEELRLLDLSWNKIKGWMGKEDFAKLQKLETLDLSYNSLNNTSILSSLNGLTALKTLNLGGNSLDSFSAQDVQNLRNFKVLSLRNNHMNDSVEGLCQLKDLQELDISNNMFSAQLPECLSNLTNLRALDVGSNLFSGRFPSFTTNHTSLAYLALDGNYMNGSFSLNTLANHTNLEALHISSFNIGAHIETENTKWFPKFQLKSLILINCNLNMDKGSVIPTFLSYQYNLIQMDLSRNKLVGSFPSWLIRNHHIECLNISNNNLSGFLPRDIGIFLPNVTTLDISWNSFEGNIPSSIGKMKELWYLDFSHNNFSGELPKQLAKDWNGLYYMVLSNNFLSGNIPKFRNSVNMRVLFLDNNNFSGTLDDVLGSINTRLGVLSISNNSISGTIPSSIGMFSDMYTLLLAENLLEGEIPIEISNMTSLEIMDLSQNKLIGSIPYFSNIKSLRFLYLGKNKLSGSIPFDLIGSSQLKLLDLTDNKFSGKIPNRMGNLSELRVLLLGGNKLEGGIPTQLCLLKNINIMDLSRNMLNSSIPSCFQNMPFGQYDHGYGAYFRPYHFNSSLELSFVPDLLDDKMLHLEAEFRTKHMDYYYKGKVLENMTGLDLSCNNLTGIIPSQIGNLQKLIALNLSHNYLSAPIPITFSNLTEIESLDLSYNKLSGNVPSQLTQLHFLEIFNVSYNNLSGTPPSARQFGNFDEGNYKGNPGLCGPLLNRKCEGIASSPSSQSNIDGGEKETKVDMISFYWSFAGSYITILLAFITVLCINARWRMAWFYYISKVMRTCFPSFPLY
ncbi:receptor-like protein 9a isoform X1 [Trifolium pratense]|uniref:receptor-like protein 9a isoform X1 n=1 Tax=Trifolium pratense TaxID=57577 RepID=UPI001E6915F6|nr:receptor-like protein 9a isoform X1 [Trifolium pratense]